MNAADSIRLSVAEHEADLSARRDVHEAIQDADVAHIRAESAIAEAEQVIDKTNHDLGTAY
jgi:stalled ribosome rescue protein Dom34